MIVLARCAPGNSWVNPAERIMSIINLGLQNCALERQNGDGAFKSASSMSQVRELISKNPELKEKWVTFIEPVQSIIQSRFTRLSLKDKQFVIENPADGEDIDLTERQLRELFSDLDLIIFKNTHT